MPANCSSPASLKVANAPGFWRQAVLVPVAERLSPQKNQVGSLDSRGGIRRINSLFSGERACTKLLWKGGHLGGYVQLLKAVLTEGALVVSQSPAINSAALPDIQWETLPESERHWGRGTCSTRSHKIVNSLSFQSQRMPVFYTHENPPLISSLIKVTEKVQDLIPSRIKTQQLLPHGPQLASALKEERFYFPILSGDAATMWSRLSCQFM